ncbi:MAG: PIN domain-containing protein [Thermodesulfobacteriota bacterium]
MALKALLDSVILIDHFNNVPEASQFILDLIPGETAISVITRAEILVGFESSKITLVKAFLDQYETLPIDKTAADEAADLRRTHGWKLPDALQAALATLHRLRFYTRNTKDFDPRKHPFVEIPYRI